MKKAMMQGKALFMLGLLPLLPLLACSSPSSDAASSPAQGGAPATPAEATPADTSAAGAGATRPLPGSGGGDGPAGDGGSGAGGAEGDGEGGDPTDAALPGEGGAGNMEQPASAGSGGSDDTGVTEPVGGAGASSTDVEGNCSGMVDGPYCGDELTVKGNPNVLFGCETGEVIGTTSCSGKCNFGECSTSNGLDEGNPDDGIDGCGLCRSKNCPDEWTACESDQACIKHLSCEASCVSLTCVERCLASLHSSPGYDALLACQQTQCASECQR